MVLVTEISQSGCAATGSISISRHHSRLPRPRAPERMKPIGRSLSSCRCPIRLAVRASSEIPLSAASGNPASSITAGMAPFTLIGSDRPQHCGKRRFDLAQLGDVRPFHPLLGREREQQVGARVAARMLRMAEAGNRLLPARSARTPSSAGVPPATSSARNRPAASADPARPIRTPAAPPRPRRGTPRARREGHPRRHHARHQPMLGDRDQHRVGQEELLVVRLHPRPPAARNSA